MRECGRASRFRGVDEVLWWVMAVWAFFLLYGSLWVRGVLWIDEIETIWIIHRVGLWKTIGSIFFLVLKWIINRLVDQCLQNYCLQIFTLFCNYFYIKILCFWYKKDLEFFEKLEYKKSYLHTIFQNLYVINTHQTIFFHKWWIYIRMYILKKINFTN